MDRDPTNRREFTKTFLTTLAGLSFRPDTIRGASPSLQDGLATFVNDLNRETGALAGGSQTTALSQSQSQEKIDLTFAEASLRLGARDSLAPSRSQARGEILISLLDKGLFLYAQEVDHNRERFLPILRLYSVVPLPVSEATVDGASPTTAKCFEVSAELSLPTAEEILPSFSALTQQVGPRESVIIVNPIQCKRDLAHFQAAGIAVDATEYRDSVLRNELASHLFLERYGMPNGNNPDRTATFPNGGTATVSFVQLSEAYSDWQALRNDSTAPVMVVRLLASDLPQYSVSRNILTATLRKLSADYPEDFRDVGTSALALARKLTSTPPMRERFTTLLTQSYEHAFKSVFLPLLRKADQ
jgi:hypothetical protein